MKNEYEVITGRVVEGVYYEYHELYKEITKEEYEKKFTGGKYNEK